MADNLITILYRCHESGNLNILEPSGRLQACNGTVLIFFFDQQILTSFFVPPTSINERSSTFYAGFRYVYRMFLSGRISKIQRISSVQK